MSRIDHPRVAAWLDNFSSVQRDTAALLVESLELVSETDLRRELGDLIARVVASVPAPVAAFPAREVSKGLAAHGEGRDGTYNLLEPGLPGSEAIVGSILTGVSRRHPKVSNLLVTHDLVTLRDRKVRTFLLVDDFSGSGKRLVDYHRALLRHPTVRSWTSLGLIEFHVVAYAATKLAARLLRKRFGGGRVHFARACPTFASAGWTPEQLSEVEALCRSSAGRRRRDWALGFRDSRALIAFEHTAPNNLPFVLWKVADGWNSLFEFKGVPSDLLRLFTMRPGPVREPLAGSAGARRIGQIIDLLGHRVRNVGDIAEVTAISIDEVSRLLVLVQELGLAGANLRLTDAGRIELKRWRTAHAIRELPDRSDPYYPHQLRAER